MKFKKPDKMALRRYMIGAIFVLVVSLTALNIWLAQGVKKDKQQSAESFGEADIGGDFTLTDHNGNTVTDDDFRGKLMLVFFGFTHCPDICPVSLMTMTNALNQLGDGASQVAPVFITIDPERDTPEVIRNYLSNFHPSFVGLTGTAEQIKTVTAGYKTYYTKQAAAQAEGEHAEHGENYSMDHSGFIYLIGRDGKYLAHFAHNDSEQMIGQAIQKYLE